MPQITVTLDEMTYMDLVHNLPKGMKSAFVNRAVSDMMKFCGGFGNAMHKYARHGQNAAADARDAEVARRNENQKRIDDWDEKNRIKNEESANERWIREQKEALE